MIFGQRRGIMAPPGTTLLLSGASGQVGSSILLEFALRFRGLAFGEAAPVQFPQKVAFVYCSNRPQLEMVQKPLLQTPDGWMQFANPGPLVKGFQVDLAHDSSELNAMVAECKPAIVVNCAAVARPKDCEADPEKARRVNVPEALIASLKKNIPDTSFFIHISTDLVFDGKDAKLYTEESETRPLNVYGKTKLQAEQFLNENWPNHVCLRSSMVFGDLKLPNVKCSFFNLFISESLQQGKKTSFFNDEFRCPTFLEDFIKAIDALIARWLCNSDLRSQGIAPVYNFGSARMSRLEMAKSLAEILELDSSLIESASAATLDRGALLPLDAGMDSSRIEMDLIMKMTSWEAGLIKLQQSAT